MSAAAAPPLRVLLLGGGGLLGSAFRRAWERDPRVSLRELTRAEMNLTRTDQIDRALDGAEFDLLVNAAAYTQVDDAEIQPELAMAVNTEAPARLAERCAERGARMVHFSTDYVFDGQSLRPYTEADRPAPLGAYGLSKLLGEQRVLRASGRHLVARLAWLFGPGRDAFPEWVLRQACALPEVGVVADKTGCPTYSADVVSWIASLVLKPEPDAGLVHLCNGPPCSWLEYGQSVLDTAADLGWPLRTTRLTPVPLASLPGLTAPRPLHSALDTSRFTRLTGVAPSPWPAAVRRHLEGKPPPLEHLAPG